MLEAVPRKFRFRLYDIVFRIPRPQEVHKSERFGNGRMGSEREYIEVPLTVKVRLFQTSVLSWRTRRRAQSPVWYVEAHFESRLAAPFPLMPTSHPRMINSATSRLD
jgi:hypothetical protein